MIKICENCKQQKLRCLKCVVVGAFGKDGDKAKVHDGDCVYEHCKPCLEKHDIEHGKYHGYI